MPALRPLSLALSCTTCSCLVLAAGAAPAAAQVARPAPSAAGSAASDAVTVSGGSARSYVADWLVNPERELELGGDLTFVTAPESPFSPGPGQPGRKLRFTDVGLLHLHLRYSTGGHIEVAGELGLLAKQPTYLDEPVVQSGALGLRYGLSRKWAAWAAASMGPLLGDLGNWGEVALGAQTRTSIHRTIRFQASLGGAATRLFAGDASGRPWFAEVVAHGEVLLRTPRGEAGVWLGADYRVPVYHDAGTGSMDPSVRLGFQAGLMLGYVDKWDLYMAASAVDRGDLENPATTLPILDGGFDQTQVLFGAARRFDLHKKKKDHAPLQLVP